MLQRLVLLLHSRRMLHLILDEKEETHITGRKLALHRIASESLKWSRNVLGGVEVELLNSDGVRKKASTCRYVSSSPHMNNHAMRFVSMGFPCLDISFMKASKYGLSTEAVDRLCTLGMQRKSITPSLVFHPMVLDESNTNKVNVNEFDLNALK